MLPCFIEIPIFNANSADLDKMLHVCLDLHCLRMSLLWDARLKWVKVLFKIVAYDNLKYLFIFFQRI